MPYNPSTDFVGLWRAVSGGVEKVEMPGVDFMVSALTRAGLMRTVTSQTAPTTNQSTTAWFQPANPSYGSEGTLFLWDPNLNMYVPATPELFHGGSSGGSDGGGGGTMGTTALTFAINQEVGVTIAVSTWTIMPLTATPQVDTDGGWDPASKKYTPKKAGYYAFSVRAVPTLAAGQTGGIAILKNDDGIFDNAGADVVVGISTYNGLTSWLSTTGFAQMNGTTDYVRYFGYTQSGTMQAIGSSPAFAALLFP